MMFVFEHQGLGKTLQTISLLGYLQEFRGITGPHMVVAPKSTLGNWMNEIKRFCPVLRAVKFLGNPDERVSVKYYRDIIFLVLFSSSLFYNVASPNLSELHKGGVTCCWKI